MSFDLGDYVDVAERISVFKKQYPDGVLQSELQNVEGGWLCKAYAYRTADDPRPGIGHAFEPVPGKTPYTKDSEAMNAETSAWGRAIVALGFETKKIASANEVRNRTHSGSAQTQTTQQQVSSVAADGTWVWPSGKHQGKTLEDTPVDYLRWYEEKGPKPDVRAMISAHLGGPPPGKTLDDVFAGEVDRDIPFGPTVDGGL